MKRKIALLLSVAILFGFRPPKKNENNNQTLELDKALNTNNSLLWQISGNGLNQPSYLFGTIHIISTQDYFLGKNVQKKLENSHELIMEMDLENMDIAALSAISILDSGKTIKNYLSDSDYQIIQTFMEDSIGVKKFTFEQFYARLKPFYLEQLIYIKYLGQDKESYEDNLKKIADRKKITVSGLETMEEQLQFLEEIPIAVQLKSMIKTIKEYSSETARLDALIKDYKSENLEVLSKAFEAEEDTIWNDKLLVKRNNNWIPALQMKMEKKSCFIAVGAGHLGGAHGLIALLKAKGYTLEPIASN